MNPKIVSWLQTGFWILGWLILVLTLVSVATQAYFYFQPVFELWPKQEFYFLKQTQILFSSIGQAFFAFLVSSVFGMIFHRAPVKQQQTEAFLKLTCMGFVGAGVVGVISWVQFAIISLPQFEMSTGLGLVSIIGFSLSVLPYLFSFMYAITIYILYRQFSNLITFESEVV